MWRSLVAHLTGGQGAVGSNPIIPTITMWKPVPFRGIGFFIAASIVERYFVSNRKGENDDQT